MRQLVRLPLSDHAVAFLSERRLRVAAAGTKMMTPREREEARRNEARRLWGMKDNKAFDEIRAVLRAMAPGHEFCMYCDYSLASAIDHFQPLGTFPDMAFMWENFVWSCSICNGDYKGDQFPLDGSGLPLLLDPTRDNPQEHLGFAPASGKLVGRTPKGDKTIEVLGFDRRSDLDRTRKDAFCAVQCFLVLYAEACSNGDLPAALQIQQAVCCHPHASLLLALIGFLDDPAQAILVRDRRCAAILASYPEIRSWV